MSEPTFSEEPTQGFSEDTDPVPEFIEDETQPSRDVSEVDADHAEQPGIEDERDSVAP